MKGFTKPQALLWIAYAALSLYFTWYLLVSGSNLGIADWDPLLLYHASVFRSVYEYGQLPFWNPWYCGGNVLWQNPQVPLVSTVYPLSVALSLPVAMKLNLLLHYLLGFAGMHVLLTRLFRITWQPAVLMLASLFVLAGGAAFHITVGHVTFLPYFYLPWLLYFFIRGIETGAFRYSTAAALVLALSVYAGGVHITFMTGIGLCCLSVLAAVGRRDWRPVALLSVVGLLAGLFAAPKLVPAALFITDPRVVDIRTLLPNDVMSKDMLLNAFLDPFQYLRETFRGQNYGWHEYGNYIGSFGVLLIAGAFVTILASRPWKREHWLGLSLAMTTLVLFLLTIGDFAPYAPYVLLRHLPIVGQFRLPSRYTLLFILYATAMIAWVVRGLHWPPTTSRVRYLASVVLVLGACLLAYRNRVPLEVAFSLKPLDEAFHFLSRPPAPVFDPDTKGFGPDSPMLRAMMAGRDVAQCNEPLQLSGAVQPDRPVVFSDNVQVSNVRFSPNRVEFSAVTRQGGRVYLNEHYVRGWWGSAGNLAIDRANGLAYMTLPSGAAGRFGFTFVPPGLWTGLTLFAVGLVLAVLLRRPSLGGEPASNARPPAGQPS